ncbi:MAG: hypothetical protein R8G66_24755 [Cytophagales bacterium]|nr:hypothetical protein [Cytophagales bacterium]
MKKILLIVLGIIVAFAALAQDIDGDLALHSTIDGYTNDIHQKRHNIMADGSAISKDIICNNH